MSSQTSIPHYRETLFQYTELNIIHGEPNYETLRTLTNHLKANARLVHTTLGDGLRGHLGLVLTPAQYTMFSNTPYVCPPRPSPLVISAYQLPHVVHMAQARHSEQVCLFNESNNVDQALKQQLIKAIDDAYLTPLHNCHTYTIDISILVIINDMFTNHGHVSPVVLQEEEKIVKKMIYDPAHHANVIFNKVEDLLDL